MLAEQMKLKRPIKFDLKAVALSHGWHECSPLAWCEAGQCLQWIDRLGATPVRVSVLRTPRRSSAVPVQLELPDDWPAPERSAAVQRVTHRLRYLLAFDDDVTAFHELCAGHPTLHVLPRLGAGRLIRCPDLIENVVKVICGTNVKWTQAVKMINRIGQLGPPVPHFANLQAWPTPAEILRAGEDYLTGVCRVGYRSAFILQLCRSAEAGSFPEAEITDAIAAGQTADALRLLRGLPGIGPTSAHALLSLLGCHDHLAIDSATIAHVARTHTAGRKPSPKEVEAVYAPYGPWKNLVYWFENWLTWDTAQTLLRRTCS